MNSESKDSKSILINALPIFSKQRYPNRTTVRGIFVLNRFSTMCKTFINFTVDNLTNLCYNGIIIKRKEKMENIIEYVNVQLEEKLNELDLQLANNGIPNEITLGEVTALRKMLKYIRTHSDTIR